MREQIHIFIKICFVQSHSAQLLQPAVSGPLSATDVRTQITKRKYLKYHIYIILLLFNLIYHLVLQIFELSQEDFHLCALNIEGGGARALTEMRAEKKNKPPLVLLAGTIF